MLITNPAPVYRTQSFDAFVETKTVSQEASTLGLKPGVLPYGRLYNDAADAGIKLVSETGVTSTWYLQEEQMSNGDVAGWIFKPTPETIRNEPKIDGWKVLIVND